jgi:hypothetical protein
MHGMNKLRRRVSGWRAFGEIFQSKRYSVSKCVDRRIFRVVWAGTLTWRGRRRDRPMNRVASPVETPGANTVGATWYSRGYSKQNRSWSSTNTCQPVRVRCRSQGLWSLAPAKPQLAIARRETPNQIGDFMKSSRGGHAEAKVSYATLPPAFWLRSNSCSCSRPSSCIYPALLRSQDPD